MHGESAAASFEQHQPGTHRFRWPDELTGRVAAVAEQTATTETAVLLAGYAALLHRLTRQDDMVIGCHPGLVPVRVRLAGDPSFAALVGQVARALDDAMAHQPEPMDPADGPLVTFGHGDVAGHAEFDLSLDLRGSRGSLRYRADLFDGSTAGQLVQRYERLVRAGAGEPQRRLSTLPLLEAAEREVLLTDWARGQDPQAPAVLVHRQVAEQVAASPDAVAAADRERQLTYRELDRAASRLGALLRREGAGPASTVALVLARGVDLVVAQLAILRAGATIVPLDPVNPPARLNQMLTQANPGVVITNAELVDRLPATTSSVLTLDWPALLAGEPTGPDSEQPGDEVPVNPDQLAYVTYTSGSTGTPKGVMITHRSLASTVAWSRRTLALTAADRVGMTASPGFDVSVLDTFTALTAGASVHAPDGELLTSPGDLQKWLLAERITVTFLPTPLAETMLGMPWPRDGSPRLLHVGGAVLHRHPDPGPPFDVLNLYGVTEVGVWSTCARVEPGRTGVPSIGRPIDGAEVFVLDEHLEPVPAGVPGEVFLGGVGVAWGYLGGAGLTAERFVPHPWEPGARLYRTGDLARWRRDGELDFIGRTDHQIQSSGGVRIELGEIEAALATYPAVTQAVATAVDGRPVGYVTGGPGLDPDSLRAHLADRLPRYMVPSDYVVLDRFPLTPTGKIDRRALPSPAARTTSAPYEPPRTDLERQLARIWQEVLGTNRVGIHDSFFDIGGNSMALVQVYGHLASIASREVSLVELYEHPTIAAFARHLANGDEAAGAGAAGHGGQVQPAEPPAPAHPDRARVSRLRRNRLEESRSRD